MNSTNQSANMAGHSSSSHTSFSYCYDSRLGNFVFAGFAVASILLLLPLAVYVLFLGHRRWRRQHSAHVSHADIIAYHMVVMEMAGVSASVFYCVCVFTDLPRVMASFSTIVVYIASCGQVQFHTLACVERYVAVVYPVTYMHLRKGRFKIRDVVLWCVWLLSLAEIGLMELNSFTVNIVVYVVQQALSLAAIFFCSLAVLRALKRPGPGDQSQTRKKAFNTITVIMGALLLRFTGSLVCTGVYSWPSLSFNVQCVVLTSGFWLSLPSGLVLPLLYLHRAGKLRLWKSSPESEQAPK
ncbi:uncharacterized protein V6R79_008916 [Siganus canaliculatus]